MAEAEDRVKAAMLVMVEGATVTVAAWGEAVWSEAVWAATVAVAAWGEAVWAKAVWAEAVVVSWAAKAEAVVTWADGSGGRKMHRTTRRNPGTHSRSSCRNNYCIL